MFPAVTSLLEGPYGLLIKIAAPLLLAAGLFVFGYYEGYKHEKVVYQSKIVTQVLVQTKYLPQETKIIHDQVVVNHTIHDKVYVDVPKLVPDSRVCDLPAAGVGMLNANRSAVPPVR